MASQGQKKSNEDEHKLVKKIKNYIYDPVQIIGSGFSSNVYKGLNELNGETIAIKVLELSKIQSQVQKYLLNNQINALRALSHPHILKTVQILMTKNNVYIMTQFCQNGDLQQHVRKQGRLQEEEALRIIRDIAEGYIAIDEKKIVHRDLKTANIFLTTTGARIADFGFCEFVNESKKPQMFYNVGSPAYMSPESYRDNVYSAFSDVWSMGIILYEMLTGQTPDKTLSYSQMSNNLMAGRISCGNNEQVRKILAGCFKRDLKERFTPFKFLEAINNQISRQQRAGLMRPPSVYPVKSSIKVDPQASQYSPTDQNQRSGKNKQMFSSQIPVDRFDGTRSQSPFKTRFVNQLNNREPSPMKPFVKEDTPRKVNIKGTGNVLKNLTEMLLFLYRLLSYLNDSDIKGANFIRLILFRHRSHLQSSVERIMASEKLDRTSYEPFKEFQFLKSRFDEAYLQKESQPTLNPLPTQVLSKLNQLSNQLFTDLKSLMTYCGLILDGCKQCEKMINSGNLDSNQSSNIGILLDYMLIHFEILQLYSEGLSVDRIAQDILQLASVLKDQPKKLGPKRYELLMMKFHNVQNFYENWSGDFSRQSREEGRYQDIPERRHLIQNGFF